MWEICWSNLLEANAKVPLHCFLVVIGWCCSEWGFVLPPRIILWHLAWHVIPGLQELLSLFTLALTVLAGYVDEPAAAKPLQVWFHWRKLLHQAVSFQDLFMWWDQNQIRFEGIRSDRKELPSSLFSIWQQAQRKSCFSYHKGNLLQTYIPSSLATPTLLSVPQQKSLFC